jgi:hypothetical protein
VFSSNGELNYHSSPSKNILMTIKGLEQSEQRLSFSQKNKRNLLSTNLTWEHNWFQHMMHASFEELSDANSLGSSLQDYLNKTGSIGYGFQLIPADSISITADITGLARSEEDKYTSDIELHSKGFQISGKTSAGKGWGNTRLGIDADVDLKRLDWEYYRNLNCGAYLDHHSDALVIHNRLLFNLRKDKLFIWNAGNESATGKAYSLYDTQQRKGWQYSGALDYNPSAVFGLSIREDFDQRTTLMITNTVRNNADLINQASMDCTVRPLAKLKWNSRASHSYAVKDFIFADNTRYVEIRNLFSSLDWEYLPGDTLSCSFETDLQITSFPKDEHKWDNDLRNIRFNVGNTHYWHDRIRLANRFLWSRTDDVYISSVMSDNTKTVNSISLIPACSVLIGDKLLFNQNYQLRADYTSYRFDESNKELYRQILAEYRLVYDTFPLISRSSDSRWMSLPYGKSGSSSLLAYLSFAYERNEYAKYEDPYYSIYYKNIRYAATFSVVHGLGDVSYTLQPRISWGTWQEYSLLAGLNWKIDDNSVLSLNINPIGESISSLEIRTSLNLNMSF